MIWLIGCVQSIAEVEPISVEAPVETVALVVETVDWDAYPFLSSKENIRPLQKMFMVPSGYKRMAVEEGTFAQWLRNLPIENRKTVYSFNGSKLSAPAAAIVPIDVGRGDVQQCADSILRLYSEYRWHQQNTDNWGIHFTSGDLSSWKDWKKGERFSIKGSKVNRVSSGKSDDSYSQYQKWLHHSFLYAGTRSLHKDARSVSLGKPIQPGDFFVSPGSPGHAILVLDVAEPLQPGYPPIALLGQGFMPAQEFHVIADRGNHVIENWFALPTKEGEGLSNPSWYPLPRSGLFRFP